MNTLVLDLHDVFNSGKDIKQSLGAILRQANEQKIPLIEIIPGKGSGQLRRTVIRFLEQPHIKTMYHHIQIDEHNRGRLFVHL
jgi:DNA-nicking Smr family endonuclease